MFRHNPTRFQQIIDSLATEMNIMSGFFIILSVLKRKKSSNKIWFYSSVAQAFM